MKKLLLIPLMAVGLTACISENAPSVIDYAQDEKLYNTDKAWCKINPAKRETVKCLNVAAVSEDKDAARREAFFCSQFPGAC